MIRLLDKPHGGGSLSSLSSSICAVPFVLQVGILLGVFLALMPLSTHALSSSQPVSQQQQQQQGLPSNKATQIMQGVGPVDMEYMNRYNLESLQEILSNWRLNLRQKPAETAVDVFLDARNPDYFVQQVTVSYPRVKDAGLGLVLEELAGGRPDGLGITVVTGLVEGGPADQATVPVDILPGDVLAKVAVVRRKRLQQRDVVSEQEEFVEAKTEGLCYDETVNAITGTLPSADERYQEMYKLTLNRIRRKPRVRVKLQYPKSQNEPDATIELFAGENLRMGMLLRGVKLNDPLAKRFDTKNGGNCGANGLCRTCSVTVQKGADLLNPQRLNEKQIFENAPRWRLACKAIVGYGMKEGEMTIRVNPSQFD